MKYYWGHTVDTVMLLALQGRKVTNEVSPRSMISLIGLYRWYGEVTMCRHTHAMICSGVIIHLVWVIECLYTMLVYTSMFCGDNMSACIYLLHCLLFIRFISDYILVLLIY